MAKKKESEDTTTRELIDDLNKKFGTKVAFDLSSDIGGTNAEVKYWIPTGSKVLDYCIANKRGGGIPGGRVVMLYGSFSSGKTHVALQTAVNMQKQGGLVVFIDSEQALVVSKLKELGINTEKNFIYSDLNILEDVFQFIEIIIQKSKIPTLIIFDSLASSVPKAEAEGAFEDSHVGLAARRISMGIRKITGMIAKTNSTLLLLNQTRVKINAGPYANPIEIPGGMSVRFASSLMVELNGFSKVENAQKDVIGIDVRAKITKNKVAPPHRKAEFKIMFGKGMDESETIFDILKEHGEIEKDGKKMIISGDGAWKLFSVRDAATDKSIIEKKFHKVEFGSLMKEYESYIEDMLEVAMTHRFEKLDKENETAVEEEEKDE